MTDHIEDIIEEEQNIDDLVDYNDFESKDCNSKDDMDSFNNDILKLYEDHKKNANAKTNEATNAQRPLSSYQRVKTATDNKKESSYRDEDNEENNYEKNCEDNFEDNLYNDYEPHFEQDKESFSVDYELQEFEQIANKLRHFSKSISKGDFCENLSLFVNFADFRDILKKIRFDCTPRELRILFCHNNPDKDEGYVLMKNFYHHLNLQFKEVRVEPADMNYDMHKINQEFRNLHSEILDIVKQDLMEESNKRMKSGFSGSSIQSGKIYANVQSAKSKINSGKTMSNTKQSIDTSMKAVTRPVTTSKLIVGNHKNKSYSEKAERTEEKKSKLNINLLFKANLKKTKEKDQNMRITFDRREKEFARDCIKKINEANKMCAELNIQKAFKTFFDEEGKLKCEVHDLSNPDLSRCIELKAFVVEWRILNKALIQKKNQFGVERGIGTTILATKSELKDNISNNKAEIKLQIKKVLTTSIRQKMKLKTQVLSLKNHPYIDEKVILEHLQFLF